jgi:hypothetical protein
VRNTSFYFLEAIRLFPDLFDVEGIDVAGVQSSDNLLAAGLAVGPKLLRVGTVLIAGGVLALGLDLGDILGWPVQRARGRRETWRLPAIGTAHSSHQGRAGRTPPSRPRPHHA